jgi:hypothetical protein
MVIAVVAIVSGAAGFAAYESHVVSITAHVEERPLLEKHLVTDSSDLAVQPPADCVPGDPNPPIEVPAETCLWWVMRVTMSNPFDVPLENVVVTDEFGAEFDVVPLGHGPVGVQAATDTSGESRNVSLQTQSRITWCASGALQPDGTCSGGQLEPSGSAYLDLLVYTKTNPSGEQGYSEGGTYEMDSGATAEWVDPNGVECSPLSNCPSVPSLELNVLPPDDTEPVDQGETPTPAPAASPEPVETPTPAPTGSPGPVESSTPAPTASLGRGETPTPEPTASPGPGETPTREPTASLERGETLTPEPMASLGRGETPTPEPTASLEPVETPTPELTEPADGAEQPTAHGQWGLSGIMLR